MIAHPDDGPLHSDADSGADPVAARIASWYRADLADAQRIGTHVMASVAARRRRARRRRSLSVCAVALLGVGLTRWLFDARRNTGASPLDGRQPATRFVYVATGSVSRVALVGDFNGWNPHATPLARVRAGALWVVDVRVPIGPHAYAYVLNDNRWTIDPAAPRAPDDGLGPTSVVIVDPGPR